MVTDGEKVIVLLGVSAGTFLLHDRFVCPFFLSTYMSYVLKQTIREKAYSPLMCTQFRQEGELLSVPIPSKTAFSVSTKPRNGGVTGRPGTMCPFVNFLGPWSPH